MLSFTLLGQAVLSKNGVPLNQFRSQKEAALLIYLAQTKESYQREFIAKLLWSNSSTKQALSNLRTALTRLRKIEGDLLIITRRSVALAPNSHAQIDSIQLLDTLAGISTVDSAEKAAILQQALDAYQGEFLENFDLPNAPSFDEWITSTREHIHRQVLNAYHKLGQYALKINDLTYGAQIAQRWLMIDPLDDAARTLLIECQAERHNHNPRAASHESVTKPLQTTLDVKSQIEDAPQAASAQSVPLTPPRFPTTPRHNLPAPHNQFFGRKAAQEAIHRRLDQSWCRIVTILGQGGAGKTRLATTIARDRLQHYPNGVWLVELAEVDPRDQNLAEAIAIEIATTLELRLTGATKPIEQLLTHLYDKQSLLVLDNFEHVLDGVQIVIDILKRCENVQLLVTSRERLELRAEWTIDIVGLSYPAKKSKRHIADVVEAQTTDAVEMFLARQAQQRWREPSTADIAAVHAICRMVEGLPLAIELAAALTRHTTLNEIADRLRTDFDMLTTSLRDFPPRHQSLHVVFEMSWRTLSPLLQQRLARLSVFRDDFTAAAAAQITQTNPQQLMMLADKSLLTYEASTNRYSLLAVMREYAAIKLSARDNAPQEHIDYYLTLLAQHTETLHGSTPQHAVMLLQADIENIRQAWRMGLAERKMVQLREAIISLSTYYQLRGLAHEGEALMSNTYKMAKRWGADATPLVIYAALEQGRFQNRLSRYVSAIQMIEAALRLANQYGDRMAVGIGHVWWGEALWRQGAYSSAENKLSHAIDIAQSLNSATLLAQCHHHFGILKDFQGDYALANNHLQQACTIWHTLGNARALSNSLNSVGLVCYHRGDLAAAQTAMEEALALCNQLGNRHLQAFLLNNLSMLATEQSDYRGAHYYLQLGLNVAIDSGNRPIQGSIYTNIGRNHLLLGDLDAAVTNLQQGVQISKSIGDSYSTTIGLMQLGQAKYKQQAMERAEALYIQALQIARQNKLKRQACEALFNLATLFAETSRREGAQRYCQEATQLAEELQNSSLLARVETAQSKLNAG